VLSPSAAYVPPGTAASPLHPQRSGPNLLPSWIPLVRCLKGDRKADSDHHGTEYGGTEEVGWPALRRIGKVRDGRAHRSASQTSKPPGRKDHGPSLFFLPTNNICPSGALWPLSPPSASSAAHMRAELLELKTDGGALSLEALAHIHLPPYRRPLALAHIIAPCYSLLPSPPAGAPRCWS
jgi:hypothetical protein